MDKFKIRQKNRDVLTGDETSIKMIFNNITGRNFSGHEYEVYKKYTISKWFDLNHAVELWCDDTLVESSNIK